MDPDIALWSLCFLIAAVTLFLMGQLGLAMCAILILTVGLLVAGE